MARQREVEDFSAAELRQLLMQKSRAEREARLEAYRRSGRIVQTDQAIDFNTLSSDLDEEEYTPRRRNTRKRRGGMDKFLLLVEIVAVAGLLFIIFNGANLLKNLNQQVAAIIDSPTATPAPLITAVILPGGHNAPIGGTESQFNESEIPEHLRQSGQLVVSLPLSTPSPQQARQIQIPAIGVNAPVVMGDDWEQLKMGAGQHFGSGYPGESGNLVISAHNDIFGEIFRYLDRLKIGDEIIISTQGGSFTYLVTNTEIVEPTRVDVMAPTNESTITLISCYPYLVDNKRIVVQGLLK